MKIKEVREQIKQVAGHTKMMSTVLRLLRKVNDMTIKEMSEKTGLSEARISNCETGRVRVGNKDVTAYSKGLDIPEVSILFFAEEGQKETVIGKVKYAVQLAIIKFMIKAEEN